MRGKLEHFRRSLRHRRTLALLASVATVSIAMAEPVPTTAPANRIELTSAAGAQIAPLEFSSPQKAVVLIFVATDCPISNGYAPTIARLAREHGGGPGDVAFALVYSDPDVRPADALKHQATYALPGTAVLDPRHRLANLFRAAVTPVAVVVGPGGAVWYRGAIDDQYTAVGHKRFAATQHFLADALDDVVAGRRVRLTETRAIGCELQ